MNTIFANKQKIGILSHTKKNVLSLKKKWQIQNMNIFGLTKKGKYEYQ